jgi:hypothetical protein
MKTRINLFEVSIDEHGKLLVYITKRNHTSKNYYSITDASRYRINSQISKAQREGRLFVWVGISHISLGIYQKP